MYLTDELRVSRRSTTAIFFTNGMVLGIWATSIPGISRVLGLTDGQLGTALSMFAVGTIAMIFLAGSIANKFGSRASIVLGGLLLSISLPTLALSPSYSAFFIILFVFGMANSIIDISMNTHGSIIESQSGRPFMSIFHSAYSFGGLAGAGLVSVLSALDFGAETNLTVAAVLMASVTLVCVKPLQKLRPEQVSTKAKNKILIRPNTTILIIATMTVLALFTENTMINWSSKFLTDVADTTTSVAAFAFGGFSLMMAVGRLIGNRFVRRHGRDVVLTACGMITASGCLLAMVAPSPVTSIAGFMLVGLGLANVIPILYSEAGSAFPNTPSLGLAMNGTIGYLGFLIGPPIIGYVSDQIGLQYTMTLPLVAMLVVGVVAYSAKVGCKVAKKSTVQTEM
ncbi:MFS transporter [Halomonas sp. V046]|uniref:MFS transporter n=1 Tax=Halomonas sp. V046 TaxID=3459611 RepID=UPI004044AFB6